MGVQRGIAERIGGSTCEKTTRGVVSATDIYQVHYATPNTSADSVLSATGLPAIGSAHPRFPGLRLSSLRPRQDDNGQRWVVDAVYSLPDQSVGGRVPPPSEATRISFRLSSWEEQIEWIHDAITGRPILNTAGAPLTKGEMIPVSHPQIDVTVEYPTGAPEWSVLGPLCGTININYVSLLGLTIYPRCGLLTLEIDDPNTGGWTLTAQIRIRTKVVSYTDLSGEAHSNENIGWDEVIQNRGLQEVIEENGVRKWVRIMLTPDVPNSEGVYDQQPATEPLPLDANGRVLTTGGVLSMRVAKYRAANWSALPFL